MNHGEFYSGGDLKFFFQIIKFNRHHEFFVPNTLKYIILLIMWKILNNESSAVASLSKDKSQTNRSLINREIETGFCVTLKDCEINSQIWTVTHKLSVVPTK